MTAVGALGVGENVLGEAPRSLAPGGYVGLGHEAWEAVISIHGMTEMGNREPRLMAEVLNRTPLAACPQVAAAQ